MKKKQIILACALFLLCQSMLASDWSTVLLPSISSTKSYNIVDYGASTTSSDNAADIQKALDACKNDGGGKVIIPTGTFLSGPVIMGSNTELYISEGAVLQPLAYGTYPMTASGSNQYPNFISAASNSSNLIIDGTGTIYGNGSAWWAAYDAATTKFKRGALIRLNKCSKILISDITLKDAPGSHITIGSGGNSNNATIRHITIDTKVPSHNTDGIDIWGPHVDIDNCSISDGDDNVAIDRESQYIRITNCNFGYGHGTSVGSYTSNVKHVLIDNCTYKNTDNGIRLKSNADRGGSEEDFVFSNLTMTNVKSLVYIDCYYDKEYTTPAKDEANAKAVTSTTPSFKNILFRNITGTSSYNKNNAIFIYGRPEQHVKNITFDNVQLTAPMGAVINFADSVVFKNGSSITPQSGNSIYSKYAADITWETTGITQVGTSSATVIGDKAVYDVSGKKVLNDYTYIDSLPKAIYIIGNKKVIGGNR